MAAPMLQEDVEDFAVVILLNEAVRSENRKRKATLPYVIQRHQHGAFHSLVQDLAEQDPKYLHKFLRMSGDTFDDLLHLVGPPLVKQATNFKQSIAPEERLAVTLRFLAEGGPYINMFFLFRIPVSTLAYLIPDTCEAIYSALKNRHLKIPNSEEKWKEVQDKFHQKWNFPQCIGALDGKHIRIQCPHNGGSLYYNYCGFHSIVLFGLVDANYRFLYYEVGAQGRIGDATIWNASKLKKDLENGRLHTPPPLATPQTNIPIPSLIVADSAFALSPTLMKPYPERGINQDRKIFNYRLSRARRIVENAFGILACRFGVYQSPMKMSPDQVKKIVLATLALHNFLRDAKDHQYCGPGAVDYEQGPNHQLIPGEWRGNRNADLFGLQAVNGGAHAQHATGTQVRDALRDFFMTQGAVPWQYRRV